ncbi:MAG: tandem-95 repeat protein [Planctomycetes bacterium]|nr:tandem-95 repeat protein [Planctomycetota bacterium]
MLVTKVVRGVLCLVVLLSISAISAGPAEGEGVMTEEDTPVSITLIGNDPDGDVLTYNVVTGPSHGRLSGTAPKLTYTPQPNFNGADSFTFVINDATVDSVPETVIIVVTAVNDPPTVDDICVTTQEDTLVSITLSGCDLDGDTLIYSVVKGPSDGDLSGTGPNLSYTPSENFNGSDSFTFKVNDGTTDSAEATVSIKLLPVNDAPTAGYAGTMFKESPPVAKDDNVATDEDSSLSITLEGYDANEDELTYTIVTNPSNGKLSGTAPSIRYTPNADFSGTDSFTFKVNDKTADSNAATISITVMAANDKPNAQDDKVSTREDSPISVIDVLTNDTDKDSDSLSVTAFTQGKNGSVDINTDNTLSYTPKANFNGNDSFTYTVCDGKGGTDKATVNVRIKEVNDAPTANNNSVSTLEDKSVSIRLTGNDLDGDSLSYSVVKGPSHGSLSGTAPKLIYTPKANFSGSDSFTFKANDNKLNSAVATVLITITAANDPPMAYSDSATTQEDESISITLAGGDDDGDVITYRVVTGPSHGILKGRAPRLIYSPNANFNGSDSLTFKTSDKRADSKTATVSITVKPVNDAPTANNSSVMTQEDKSVSISLTGNDPDGDLLTYIVVKGPAQGSLKGIAGKSPKLSYTPKANFSGSDSFTYKVSDKTAESAVATALITVKAVNDRPTARDDSATTMEDKKVSSIDVLTNDTDVEKDPLKVASVTQGKNGSVAINGDKTLSYTPKENFYGDDAFTYTVSDGKGGTDAAAVRVKVEAVNDAPTFTSTPVTKAAVGKEYNYDVDATDPDIVDTLAYSLVIEPMGMTIDTATGLIKWTPANTQTGANEVAVRVADGSSTPASNTQPFTINVSLADIPVEVAPSSETEKPAETGRKILSVADKSIVVQASDNHRRETDSGLYTSYDFSNVYIPEGAKISSVVVYVEHFEQEEFPEGKLQWTAGTGWPDNPMVWASINAPVYSGETNESTDLWDVTSFVDTPEKVNSLQFRVKNNDDVAKRKTSVDYIYAVVEWK